MKLKPKGVHVSFVFRRLNADQVPIETDAGDLFRVEPHDDLLGCLRELVPHLVALTEQEPITKQDLKKNKLYERFAVREVRWFSKDGHEGIELKGYRMLTTAHHVPLATRRVMFQAADSEYEFVGQLEASAARLHTEVLALIEGKCARPKQTSITDPEQQQAGTDTE